MSEEKIEKIRNRIKEHCTYKVEKFDEIKKKGRRKIK